LTTKKAKPKTRFQLRQEELPEMAQAYLALIIKRLDRPLTEIEEELVLMLAYSGYLHREARVRINETGILVKGARGAVVNPMLKVTKDETDTFIKIAQALQIKPKDEAGGLDIWDKLAQEILKS
jgi:phage terminase small subunit